MVKTITQKCVSVVHEDTACVPVIQKALKKKKKTF